MTHPLAGAVVSEQERASKIGADILLLGGNAVDAIIATTIAVNVLVPYHSDIGGGGFAILRLPDGRYESLDFRHTAPKDVTMEFYQRGASTAVGGSAVAVPGQMRGLEELHKKFGKLPWAELLMPSIKLARDGAEVRGDLRDFTLRECAPGTETIAGTWYEPDHMFHALFKNGKVLDIGETYYRPELAQTLSLIAENGASAFYEGEVAQGIVNVVKARGGLMTLEDLKSYKPVWREPISAKYRNNTLWTVPAPASGAIWLSAMGTLSQLPVSSAGSVLDYHRVTEALRLAYGQRTQLGDPDFVPGLKEKQQGWISEESFVKRVKMLSDEHTWPPDYYKPPGAEIKEDAGTSNITAADETGLVVSITTTIGLNYGSHIMVPGYGFILNDSMDDFSVAGQANGTGYEPTAANYVAGGKRPLSSSCPYIIENARGEPVLAGGSAGGSTIISANTQVARNILDHGMTAAEALLAPRLHNQILPNVSQLERSSTWQADKPVQGFSSDVADGLATKGHVIEWVAALAPHDVASLDVDAYPYDLGHYTRPLPGVTLPAQKWFDRGLNWAWAFNHLEAARCFEQVILIDQPSVWGRWGLAYSLGPNYNKPWEMFDPVDLQQTLTRIRLILGEALNVQEQSVALQLATALAKRYGTSGLDFQQWNIDYAAAMADVYAAQPDDPDVSALYADALMNLAPWNLWDTTTGAPRSISQTLRAQSVLETALQRHPLHPGLLHLYVHLMEMSPTPEVAIPCGNRLRGLSPDGGHLEHMPTHLDLLVGDWKRAMDGNVAAIVADDKYAQHTSTTDFYAFYRLHDVNTLIFAAMLGGHFGAAMKGVEKMEALVDDGLLRIESPPMADWLEVACTSRAHVLVRFGRWHDILALPLPVDQELYCVTTATIQYARGVAHAVLGHIAKAEVSRRDYVAAIARVPATRVDYPNKCIDLLAIGLAMLDGEIDYRKCLHESAFAHLRRSVQLYDNLLYCEPYSWKLPPRHSLGALLLEQGRVQEAAVVFGADLGLGDGVGVGRQMVHPNNPWALVGYWECLRRLGQGETELGKTVQQKIAKSKEVADIDITVGCLCATELAVDAGKLEECDCPPRADVHL